MSKMRPNLPNLPGVWLAILTSAVSVTGYRWLAMTQTPVQTPSSASICSVSLECDQCHSTFSSCVDCAFGRYLRSGDGRKLVRAVRACEAKVE